MGTTLSQDHFSRVAFWCLAGVANAGQKARFRKLTVAKNNG
jgi:hypothetical protein